MKRFLSAFTILILGVAGLASAVTARHTHGVAYASVTHTEGSNLYVSGDFKDSFLGRGAIVYVVTVSSGPQSGSFTVKARRVTIYTAKGSLTGTGKATQTVAPNNGPVTVSGGTFSLTRGTGAYAGHRFTGTFGGPQNNGVYKFTYAGTYR